MWCSYYELEPIRRLQNEGRELLGNNILLTVKRDGENVSVWKNESDEVVVSSHNCEVAGSDIVNRLKLTPEWNKIQQLLNYEYQHKTIYYGELLKQVSPTRVEPKRKHIHWILFDAYNIEEKRYLSYTQLYMLAYSFKIPIVKFVDYFSPSTMEELKQHVESALKWCKRHRREGVVGKDYKNQVFFKEKITLPKKFKLTKSQQKVMLPMMPEDKILRAFQHAFDEVGEGKWMDKRVTMPVIARHVATEAREHNYSAPKDIYRRYVELDIEMVK